MVFKNDSNEFISLSELNETNKNIVLDSGATDKTFIWNTSDILKIVIDKIPYELSKGGIIFLTEFHHIDHIELESARMVRFNKSFFCMIDQDKQVGSKGLLFYGATHVPIVILDPLSTEDFEVTWTIFKHEMQRTDILQKEMLETLLKRMLILSVRILRNSTYLHQLEKRQIELIREFNYLVENHFCEHHDVAFYASALNKSPKTLSNTFLNYNRSPLHIIHDRILIHAKRQISYTSLSVKEIAYQLGYNDIQTFSRFFKKCEGISPSQYRDKHAI
ncbi:helix-turn-helix domain-containing protein [Pedobacter sp. MC2016-15]|uniref:AraC family transcriptional regulator n=1 Tax=Pedobacter sp. MC2016-15 TaxID=2994473 RepID=UPI002247D781|nr:helix-turn-helix domain-containing protein [Pedobacter sp. MC2016-15]MCX2478330.1 helix-turn-helix domain-containing protein [Pedobacter sp. MC2016-15]